jgi:predicted NBD/HSP70 family sugar kinase
MILGIDIGGTKTLLGVFTSEGELQETVRFETPKSYTDFTESLKNNVVNLTAKDFQKTVVAAPGIIDRKRGVVLAFGNLSWTNIPLSEDVERIVNCPVRLENDAKLAALSEANLLKPVPHKVFYITISTGIGGGLILDGKIATDFEDTEVGHMLLEHSGRLMRWQDFASGKAIVAKFGKKASEIDDEQTWYAVARNIALGLIDIIATYQPDVIVIGGGVGSHLEKFQPRLEELLRIYDNPLLRIPPIVKAQNSEQAVIYGCYRLAVT